MHADFLVDALILLSAAVIFVPLFQRLKAGPVLGYLFGGAAVGPAGLGLLDTTDEIKLLAELGVVFLLFAIGLELKLGRLWVMRRLVFGLGCAQVVLTMAVLTGLLLLVGAKGPEAVVLGGGLALSSTAVVLQILTERRELNTRSGRITFSTLLMQDLAVVPLLAVLFMLGNGVDDAGADTDALDMLVSGGKALAVVAAIVLSGRYLLRPVMQVIAASRNTELFTASVVLVALGVAWATAAVGLSMALGAFMAGLMLAETEFRHQVEADIQPFRGLLLGLFFMTVGMSVDLGLLVHEAQSVGLLVAALLAVKALIVVGLVRAFGYPFHVALPSGLLLAQGGEFAFVLFGLAAEQGILGVQAHQLFVLAVSVTMLLTPLLAVVGGRLGQRVRHHTQPSVPSSLEEASELSDHVVICGFGRVGQTVGKMLAERNMRYVALDLHADRVATGLSTGHPVFYADASRAEVLRAAGAEQARAVVITLDDVNRAERAVAVMRQCFPEVPVFARARDQDHSDTLRRQGATVAVPETIEASLQLGATILRQLGNPATDVAEVVEAFRADDYARLSSHIHADGRLYKRV